VSEVTLSGINITKTRQLRVRREYHRVPDSATL
jgi:hypothetical protein